MTLAGLQAELVEAVQAIPGLRVIGHGSTQVSPPAFLVPLPNDVRYRVTKGIRLALTWELWVLVAKADSRVANDNLLAYLELEGERSIPAALHAGTYTECDGVDVLSCEVEAVTYQGVQYLGAGFQLSVL